MWLQIGAWKSSEIIFETGEFMIYDLLFVACILIYKKWRIYAFFKEGQSPSQKTLCILISDDLFYK